MSIYGPGLGTLWRLLASYGLDPRRVIREEDYSPGSDSPAGARVPYPKFDRLRAEAAELIGDPLVGLRSAQHLHPSHMGALGYAWMASASLLDGFRRQERYGRMFNEQETAAVREDDDRVIVTVEARQEVLRPHEVADANLAGLTALCRLNAGADFNPDRITMKRPQPAEPGPWYAFFRCPVEFGSDGDRLIISRAKATRPLSGSDPRIAALHEEIVVRDLAALDRDDILTRARVEIIDQLPSGRATEASVARALHMSTRTLNRRLRERGETFRSLLAGVRRQLAAAYLQDPSLSVTEIGFLLGFADSSSFARAYRQWFGCSPTAGRRLRPGFDRAVPGA